MDAADHGLLLARIRPGYDATVVDVSAAGALIETAQQLRPGAAIDLQLVSVDERRASLRGRVLRCQVSSLGATGVLYRGAIAFDHLFPWFMGDEARRVYAIPGEKMLSPRARNEDSRPAW